MVQFFRKLAGIIFLIVFQNLCFGQYAGIYTVGGINPDFTTLDSALKSLSANGIKGNVRLNVRSGTYIERITIDVINGASKTNIIQIAPDPKNNSPVIIKNRNTSAVGNFIIAIKQGFIRFDSLNFHLDTTSKFGRIIDFKASVENITFNYCTFYGKDTTLEDDNFAILFDNGFVSVNNYKILNCNFYNGSLAICHNGAGKLYESGFELINSKIFSFYWGGLFLYAQESPVVKGNYVKSINKYSNSIGLGIGYCNSFSIQNNEIYVDGTLSDAINVRDCIGSSTYPHIITNNFISGESRALFLNNTSYFNIIYNSFHSFSPKSNYMSVTLTIPSNFIFKNNIVHNLGNGYAIYLGASSKNYEMDYNNYYTKGNYLGYLNNSLRNLADIQKATGMDKHSLNANIKFNSATDLHTRSSVLNETATYISGITSDIDFETRSTSKPDIGADEFDPFPNDIYLVEIFTSNIPECGIDSAEISAVIRNGGINKLGGFNLYLEVNGDTNQRIGYFYKDTISPRQLDTVSLGKFSTYSGGVFNFKVYTSLNSDDDRLNDTLVAQINVSASPSRPAIKKDTICSNVSKYLKTKYSPPSFLRWYDSKKGGKLIIEKDSFLIKNLTKDTNFYVSSVLPYLTPGNLSTTSAGGGPSQGGFMFDVIPKKYMEIDSFAALPFSVGSQNVIIFMKKGSHKGFETQPSSWKRIDSTIVNVTSTSTFVNIPLTKHIVLEKDSTYSVYINLNVKYESTAVDHSNSDVKLTAGTALHKLFGTIYAPRTFNGRIFYRAGYHCESERVPYSIKVNKAPSPYLGKDTSFCANSGIKHQLKAGSFKTYFWSTLDTTSTITITKEGTYSVIVTDNNNCSKDEKINIIKNPSPFVYLGKDTSFCENSGINYNLNAGPGFISYKWNNGSTGQTISVKTAGEFSVVVSNNKNCKAMDTINFIMKKSPVIKLGNDTVYCTKKSVKHRLDAGPGYLNYIWSNKKTTQSIDASTGIYSVLVTDSNYCKGGDTISITEYIAPILDLGRDTTYCQGMAINKLLDAGHGYLYFWSTGSDKQSINVSKAGKYFVLIKDFYNCTNSDTILISETKNPAPNLGNDTFYCSNIGIYKKLDAGYGYSYKWSTGEKSQAIIATFKGVYFVEVKDSNNCKGQDSIQIYQNEQPLVKLGTDRIIDPSKPILESLDAGTGFKTYKWNTSATSQVITVNQEGIYHVTVTDNAGCLGKDTIEVRYWIKGNTYIPGSYEIEVYPNPANNVVNVFSEHSIIDAMEVIDMSGRIIYKSLEKGNRIILDTFNWKNGIYIVTLTSGGNLYNIKLSIVHR